MYMYIYIYIRHDKVLPDRRRGHEEDVQHGREQGPIYLSISI